MKTIHRLFRYGIRALTATALVLTAGIGRVAAQATNESSIANPIRTDDDVVYAIKHFDSHQEIVEMDRVFEQANKNRNDTIRELLAVFRDDGSSIKRKAYAAYYLGQMHAAEAVDSLAANITILFPISGHLYFDEANWRGPASANALVSIGIPAIPALIRNLEESDDENVRRLSLETLSRIEGDKDVVQLHLKKALEAQKDQAKKARLEAALKTLDEAKF